MLIKQPHEQQKQEFCASHKTQSPSRSQTSLEPAVFLESETKKNFTGSEAVEVEIFSLFSVLISHGASKTCPILNTEETVLLAENLMCQRSFSSQLAKIRTAITTSSNAISYLTGTRHVPTISRSFLNT